MIVPQHSSWSKLFLKTFLEIRYFLMFGIVTGATLVTCFVFDVIFNFFPSEFNQELFGLGLFVVSMICLVLYSFVLFNMIYNRQINFLQERLLLSLIFVGILLIITVEIFALLYFYENSMIVQISTAEGTKKIVFFGIAMITITASFLTIISSTQVFLNWKKKIDLQEKQEQAKLNQSSSKKVSEPSNTSQS